MSRERPASLIRADTGLEPRAESVESPREGAAVATEIACAPPGAARAAGQAALEDASTLPRADELTEALAGVWAALEQRRTFDRGPAEGIVSDLIRAIQGRADGAIPLAPLTSLDAYTTVHILNVASLSMVLARALRLPDDTVREIGIAALLHDVGKLQVPAGVLDKPAPLTPREFEIVKRHPSDGARLLAATPGGPDLATIVAFEHHIRFDGGGYPAMGSGWRRNPASAIVQLADIYDALRCDRPYRRGLGRDAILRVMAAESGTHFDPALLSTLTRCALPPEVNPRS